MLESGAIDAQEETNLETFKIKVRKYCRLAGKTQQALANQLNYPVTFLSEKLNGAGSALLTKNDVKEIIRALATWEAINLKSEVVELLQLRNLSCNAFSREEWATQPLSKLEAGELYNQILTANLDNIGAIAAILNNLVNTATYSEANVR